VVNEIENGRCIPELRTYEKLRGLLGLAPASSVLARPAPPPRFSNDYLTRLCACVLAARHVLLADLADALGVRIPAVREGLLALAERLAGVGFRAWEDGAMVRPEPIPPVADAVAEVTDLDPLRPLSEEQLTVLMVVAHLGAATRHQIESWRGEDSESLLERLVAKGFLEKARDTAPRKPNVFRLTTAALAAVQRLADELARHQRTETRRVKGALRMLSSR
jgi:chromosome segregation and condensation protein ScpB